MQERYTGRPFWRTSELLYVVAAGTRMSTEVVCDHCGKRTEAGIAASEWWEVSHKVAGLELDFCSTTCARAFFTATAQPAAPPQQDHHRTAHAFHNADSP